MMALMKTPFQTKRMKYSVSKVMSTLVIVSACYRLQAQSFVIKTQSNKTSDTSTVKSKNVLPFMPLIWSLIFILTLVLQNPSQYSKQSVS